jgi:hypothetical protein
MLLKDWPAEYSTSGSRAASDLVAFRIENIFSGMQRVIFDQCNVASSTRTTSWAFVLGIGVQLSASCAGENKKCSPARLGLVRRQESSLGEFNHHHHNYIFKRAFSMRETEERYSPFEKHQSA